jgi:thiol-disulfide isomerase/thioredoxin
VTAAGRRALRSAAVLCLGAAAALGAAACRPHLVQNAADLPTLAPAERSTADALAYGTPPSVAAGEADRLSLGEAAPPFSLDSLDGGRISLSDHLGRPVLVNFWATWCAPCVEEMPLLAGAAAQYRDAGLVVLLVDVGEETRLVEDFVAEHGLDLPVALDMNSETSYDYRVSGYPTSVLIDRAGRVVDVRRGAFSDGGDLRQALGLILP